MCVSNAAEAEVTIQEDRTAGVISEETTGNKGDTGPDGGHVRGKAAPRRPSHGYRGVQLFRPVVDDVL